MNQSFSFAVGEEVAVGLMMMTVIPRENHGHCNEKTSVKMGSESWERMEVQGVKIFRVMAITTTNSNAQKKTTATMKMKMKMKMMTMMTMMMMMIH
jgi:hypothetical protein